MQGHSWVVQHFLFNRIYWFLLSLSLVQRNPNLCIESGFLSSSPEFKTTRFECLVENGVICQAGVVHFTWRSGGGRGTDRDSREEGWSGQVFYSDCPPQPTVIWNKSLHASHWSDCQDCTNRGLSLAAACRDLQSVSVQVFLYKSSQGLSDHGAMTDFLPLSKRGQKVENWTGNILVLFFLLDLESGLASLASDLESLLS